MDLATLGTKNLESVGSPGPKREGLVGFALIVGETARRRRLFQPIGISRLRFHNLTSSRFNRASQ